jgi:hypothetical protein
VVIVNVGEVVALAGTVTLGGVCAAPGSELTRVTVSPPAGAGEFSVTLPLADEPPAILAGFTVIEATPMASTVRMPVRVTPAYVAEMVTGVVLATGLVVIVNAGDCALPALIVTLAGVCAAAALELLSATTTPPGGAGPSRPTLFDAVLPPPPIVVGFNRTELTAVGVTVTTALRVTPP